MVFYMLDVNGIAAYKLAGAYADVYSEACKEARRYGVHVTVTQYGYGTVSCFTVTPSSR